MQKFINQTSGMYVAPAVDVVEIINETVLCLSGEILDPEED